MTKARDLANASTALSAVDATELGYVDGVTSAIQTQMDGKIAKTLTTTTGDIIYASGANTPARLGIGSSAQVLTVASGVPSWATPATPSSGLTLINTTTFSAVTAQTVTNVFSASYDYYRLYFSLTANSGSNASFRFAPRISTTDTEMSSEYIEQYSTTVTGVESTSGSTGGIFVKSHSTYGTYCKGVLDIMNPNTASVQTNASGRFLGVNSSGQPFQYISNMYTDATTQFTGFTITSSSGTMSGTLRVYGVAV